MSKVGRGPLITASQEDELVSMHLVTPFQLYQQVAEKSYLEAEAGFHVLLLLVLSHACTHTHTYTHTHTHMNTFCHTQLYQQVAGKSLDVL